MRFTLKGYSPLEKRLKQMSAKTFENAANKSLTQMFNRAARPPGTPRGKNSAKHRAGELIRSRRVERVSSSGGVSKGSFGYVADYGPHVEFGHRLVRRMKNGSKKQVGFVVGQKFLFNNVKRQERLYRNDILKEIRGK